MNGNTNGDRTLPATVLLLTGEVVEVEADDLLDFIRENRDRIQTQKFQPRGSRRKPLRKPLDDMPSHISDKVLENILNCFNSWTKEIDDIQWEINALPFESIKSVSHQILEVLICLSQTKEAMRSVHDTLINSTKNLEP